MYCPYCGYECACENNSRPTTSLGGGIALLFLALGSFIVGRLFKHKSSSPGSKERYDEIMEELAKIRKDNEKNAN